MFIYLAARQIFSDIFLKFTKSVILILNVNYWYKLFKFI